MFSQFVDLNNFLDKGPFIKDVRRQRKEGFFRCGRPHFLVQKTPDFQNSWCVRTDRFRYSFICQDTSTRRQRRGPFRSSSQAATCYYQSNCSKVEAIPLSALPRIQQANLPAYLHT